MTRRFEFVGGNSTKFWEITHDSTEVTVVFGRIGTIGQRQSKTLASPEAANQHVQKLISEKLAKGYKDCTPV